MVFFMFSTFLAGSAPSPADFRHLRPSSVTAETTRIHPSPESWTVTVSSTRTDLSGISVSRTFSKAVSEFL